MRVRQVWGAILLLFAIGITAAGQKSASSPATSLAYVFDPGQQTVAAINLLSGEKIATAPVSGSGDFKRDALLLTPDGSRLVMLVTGTQKMIDFDVHQPATKSTAIIIDTKTMKPTQPIDLGWSLCNYSITPDSKVLVTIASGYEAVRSKNNLPGEIVATDISSGQTLERFAIPQPPSACLISRDGKTAVLLYAKHKLKQQGYSPAELQFFSVEKQAVVGKITLEGEPEMPVISPTGEFIYLVEKGHPSHHPRKNINGRIHVVSLKDMTIAAVLDAGSDPKIALPDDGAGQTLIFSDGPPVNVEGQFVDAELRVLRGASITSVLKVGTGPRYLSFSPDRKRLYVSSSIDSSKYSGLMYDTAKEYLKYRDIRNPDAYSRMDMLTAIDYTSLKVLGQIHLNGAVSQVAFTPDGYLGFVLDPQSSRMLILDLQALKAGASITSGRLGIKAEHFIIGSVEASASMFFPLAGIAVSAANSYLSSPANELMSMRPDGAFIYVLNHNTNDITVVNTRNSSIVNKIAGGGRRLEPLNGGSVLAIVANDSIHRIDTSSQKALPDVHFDKKLLNISLSPDNRTEVALTEGSVVLMDGSTGEIRSRIDGFVRPQAIIFAQKE
jgi:DNA-binding beta-propeller fold protein YncE